jgi:hypothetical protein
VPRFFFHLFNDEDTLDREGMELSDEAAAHEQAIRAAKDMASQGVADGRLVLSNRIEVVNEAGQTIDTVRFGDVVHVEA